MSGIRQTVLRRLRAVLQRDPRDLKQLANVSGVSVPTISRLRQGKMWLPSVDIIWALCQTLEVDVYWVLGSDRHEGPTALRPDRPTPVMPNRLPPEAWAIVRAQRLRGTSWPRIASLLSSRLHMVVGVNSLRRAWERKKGLDASAEEQAK